jgi:hypothetical protein
MKRASRGSEGLDRALCARSSLARGASPKSNELAAQESGKPALASHSESLRAAARRLPLRRPPVAHNDASPHSARVLGSSAAAKRGCRRESDIYLAS